MEDVRLEFTEHKQAIAAVTHSEPQTDHPAAGLHPFGSVINRRRLNRQGTHTLFPKTEF